MNYLDHTYISTIKRGSLDVTKLYENGLTEEENVERLRLQTAVACATPCRVCLRFHKAPFWPFLWIRHSQYQSRDLPVIWS